ncbi:hypothetical protein ACCC92_10865 [Mucilaginibacter sp. Mucisp84]|uniref:hypothetical protein n=1 Tax=Mucilaginibacter sp. Mucisp84 TaxID=3243058 RepID=UPI0039A5280F
MRNDYNPLDAVPALEAPAMLVHTQSFLQEIRDGRPEMQRLIKIAGLQTCPIIFTPTDDEVVQAILKENDLDVAQYYLQHNEYIVKSKFLHAVFSAETDPELALRFEARHGFSLNDNMLMGNHYFHYHISHSSKRGISLDRALDILEVYHVKSGIFKLRANDITNQFLYDLITVNKVIPNYKSLFIEFYHVKSAFPKYADTIENLLQSLHDRTMLINKCVVELKYQSLRTVTNNASTEVMYHLSYLAVLVTGSFDNLAWIINYIYDLGFSLTENNRIKVKLQNPVYPQKKHSEAYYKALAVKAMAISSYLLSDKVSCLIDFIYPLRDAIQHRSFIRPLTVGGANRKEDKLLIWFPEEVRQVLQRYYKPESFGFASEMSGLMSRDYYDIYVFSKKLHTEITQLINTVCGLIMLTDIVPVSVQQIQLINETKASLARDPFVGLKPQQFMAY